MSFFVSLEIHFLQKYFNEGEKIAGYPALYMNRISGKITTGIRCSPKTYHHQKVP